MANRRIVVATIVGTSAIVLLSDLQSGKGIPEPQTWIALGALYMLLGLTYDFAPELATPMALIIFFAVVGTKGAPLLKSLDRSIKKRKFTVHDGGNKIRGKG